MIALFAVALPAPHMRSLSSTSILSYTPGSQVTDHASARHAAHRALHTHSPPLVSSLHLL
jgi:hypothetical protein